MKYVLIIGLLIVLVGVGIIAVSAGLLPFGGGVALGEEVTLSIGDSVAIENGATLELMDVASDNRCPTDVECIIAGEAVFILHLMRGDFEDTFERAFPQSAHTQAGMSFQITNVLPKPVSTQTIAPEEYLVTILIEAAPITSFSDCVAAGNPVMQSYPRQCSGDGKTFIEDIGNSLVKQDLIRVATPQPNAEIANLIDIHGEARGFWFFEADFPVEVVDMNGNQLATSIATAQGDWMTEDFVTFVTSIPIDVAAETEALLIFHRDNPSGLSENDDQMFFPITLKPSTQQAQNREAGKPENTQTIVITNQGGAMEGHTPRGFAGSGAGLFAGDNLNPRFPNDDGVQIFTSFDLSDIPEDAQIIHATLTSSNAHISGAPYDGLGDLELYTTQYDSFSANLWNEKQGDFVCVFAESQAGPFFCDITETLQEIVNNEQPWAQFVLRFENISDGDGAQDLAMFYTTNSNTNEPGIFELSVTVDE